MRTGIISDIHANLDALKVVLDDLRAQNVDRVVCLGDIVGYGPEPNECVQRVQETCAFTVVGNHDYAALGRLDTLAFNDYARAAADWTSEALSPESRAFLEQLPLTKELDGMLLVHASPLAPEEWTYVLSYHEAERQFAAFTERLCFIGHSHLPVVVENTDGHVEALRYPNGDPLPLRAECRYLINVGSVGQPRDRDPRSAYVVYDSEADTVLLRRLEYPVREAQAKIIDAGLPPFLAFRLDSGV